MNDDTSCLIIIIICMTTLTVPDLGQTIIAVFGLALALLAHFVPEDAGIGRDGSADQREAERRRHAG